MFITPAISFAPQAKPAAAVQIRDLKVGVYAGGRRGAWTQWFYEHNGPIGECEAPGFWRDAAGMLAHGDVIAIRTAQGTGMRTVRIERDGAPVIAAML